MNNSSGDSGADNTCPDLRSARLAADRTALAAEYGIHSNRLEGIIQQQRRRARIASNRTLWVLSALIFIIVVGLAYYLALPFLRDVYNGRKLALEDSVTAADLALAALDAERDQLFATLPNDIRQTPATLTGDWPRDVSFHAIASVGNGALLVAGDKGVIVRYDIEKGTAVTLSGDWSEYIRFRQIVKAGDNTLLIIGDGGTLVRYDIASGTVTELPRFSTNYAIIRNFAQAGKEALLLVGDGGTIVRYDIPGGTAAALSGNWPDDIEFTEIAPAGEDALLIAGERGVLVLYKISEGTATALPDDGTSYITPRDIEQAGKERLLLAGGGGTILQYDIREGNKTVVPGNWPDTVKFENIAPANDSELLIAGDEGTLVRYDITTGATDVLPRAWHDELEFRLIAPAGEDVLLVGGDGGVLVRYDISKGTAVALSGNWPSDVTFWRVVKIGEDAMLIAGDRGTLIRYDIASSSVTALPRDWPDDVVFWEISEISSGAMLIAGDRGTLIRYDIVDGTGTSITGDWPDSTEFYEVAKAGDNGFLAAGDRGTLVRISNHTSDELSSAQISSDLDLRTELDRLPKDVQSHAAVVRARNRLTNIEGRRSAVEAERDKAQNNLDALPTGLFRLNEQRENFKIFMAICRGISPDLQGPPLPYDGQAGDPDEVTLACTEAWQAQLDRDRQTWWQTVAVQVPPGVLLLFLLATLGGLYRYNLRMAGFHHSRADALELLTEGNSRQKIDELIVVADALAADKVEFGRANTPSDQAVEIVRALLERTKT